MNNGESSTGMHVGSGGAGGKGCFTTSTGGAGGPLWADFFEQQRRSLGKRTKGRNMKYPDDGYPPDKDEFDIDAEERADNWRVLRLLLAVALIIAGVSAWRYVADCSQHFGMLDCARAWAGWTD